MVVAEELVGRVVVGAGVTIERFFRGAASGLKLRVPLNVIADDQVKPAIVIHVNPSCSNRPQFAVTRIDAAEVRFLGDVLEGAVATVVIQDVSIYTRDENIRITVIVIVGDGYSHGIAFTGHAGFIGHVGERAVAIVSEQAVEILRTGFLERGHRCAVGKENVHAAVVVIVEDRHASEHQFRLVKLADSAITQLEFEPRFGGHLFEANLRSRARGSRGEQND